MTDLNTYLTSLRGRRVGVLGFGVSNAPVAEMLCEAGAIVTVYDQKSPAELGEKARNLQNAGVEFHSGDGYDDELADEVIFRSPGYLPTRPALRRAAANGARITSEMAMFFECCPCTVIGITGSDGKSTTSTVTAKLLEASGRRVWLGGNLGTPLAPRVGEMSPGDFAVVELSSFQLMDMTASPQIAIVTNVSPNHLDKHTDMNEYIDAKRAIFRCQKPGDLLVANFDNAITRTFLSGAPGRVRPFSRLHGCDTGVLLENDRIVLRENGTARELLRRDQIRIPGDHNVENYMAAFGAVCDLVTPPQMAAVASTFNGVAHRLELVRTLGGVRYYNSSIDSSPTRTAAALSVFSEPLTVILGGSDKGISFDELGELLCQKTKRIILTGATADAIESAVRRAPSFGDGTPEILRTATLVDAVRAANRAAKAGEIVLLSPACASFDAFRNFEERGEVFRRAVNELSESLSE